MAFGCVGVCMCVLVCVLKIDLLYLLIAKAMHDSFAGDSAKYIA